MCYVEYQRSLPLVLLLPFAGKTATREEGRPRGNIRGGMAATDHCDRAVLMVNIGQQLRYLERQLWKDNDGIGGSCGVIVILSRLLHEHFLLIAADRPRPVGEPIASLQLGQAVDSHHSTGSGSTLSIYVL